MDTEKAESDARSLNAIRFAGARSLDAFRDQFLAQLNAWPRSIAGSFFQTILKDDGIKNLCVFLFWDYANQEQPPQLSKKYIDHQNKLIVDAIFHASEILKIARQLEVMGLTVPARIRKAQETGLAFLRSLQQQRLYVGRKKRRLHLAAKDLGRDRDWSAVRRAKELLEGALQQKNLLEGQLSDEILVDLVNEADAAAGRKRRAIDADDVKKGLKRLAARQNISDPILKEMFYEAIKEQARATINGKTSAADKRRAREVLEVLKQDERTKSSRPSDRRRKDARQKR